MVFSYSPNKAYAVHAVFYLYFHFFGCSRNQGILYIGSHSHLIAAIDIMTGESVWETTLPDRIESSACLSKCGQWVIVGELEIVMPGIILKDIGKFFSNLVHHHHSLALIVTNNVCEYFEVSYWQMCCFVCRAENFNKLFRY